MGQRIDVNHLNIYYGDFLAVEDVNINIEPNKVTAFIGPSGCGKSTLLRQLKPILQPHGTQTGTILFEGKSLSSLSQREQSARIGFVLQNLDAQLVTDKVWHELAFGLESLGLSTPVIRRRVAEIASFFGIQNWFYKPVCELSGGQKQRVAIARVLANDPEIILCDEATSALDPMTTESILSLLQTINRTQNITIVVITHEMKVIQQICNRVAVLDEGRIQETGPVSEVFSHPQTRAAKRLVLARMQDADAPCVKLELPEDDKELAALMAYVKAHNLKVLEGEEHV